MCINDNNHNKNSRSKNPLDSSLNVVNLSDVSLSEAQLSLLSKGLKFCPTPGEPKMDDLRRDLDSFHRKMRWKSFFESKEKDPSESTTNRLGPFKHQNFKHPSTAEPQPGPAALEAFALINELELSKTVGTSPSKQNLSRSEREAISELRNNRNIVIKPADKGGATVVLNTTDYIKEAEKQLSDARFYKELTNDPTKDNNTIIMDHLTDLCGSGEIHGDTLDYLTITKPRTAQLYLLPKIHKGTIPPPGRPVVSANECPTERISQLVDHFIKPDIPRIRSYIKDTTHFLQLLAKISGLPENTIIATLDVTALYTNIPNDEAIESVKHHLEKHRPGATKPKNESLVELLRMVLTMNNFQFNGKNYLQVGGTAMGTRVAPSLANIFMADFEEKYVYPYHIQPLIWLRYIDDIFCVWTDGEESLRDFITHLNNSHQSIKFTEEISHDSVNFLDTTVSLKNGSLITDLYTKPTDTNNYLHYDSAHHPGCKKSLPYSQFLRIRRICQDEEQFKIHAEKMTNTFIAKGYPKKLVQEALIKAQEKNRETLLEPRLPPVGEKEFPLVSVSTYQPNFGGLEKIIKKNWDILSRSTATRNLNEKRVIFAYRRPKNLKDLLVRAKLNTEPNNQGSDKCNQNRCNTKSCRYCPKLDKSGKIQSHFTKREYVTKKNVSCKSNNLIYCITCKKCNKQYVGQTKRRLMERFQGHFWCIKSKKTDNNDVAKHFNLPNHSGIDDVKIHILDFINIHPTTDEKESAYIRDHIEMNWIHRLHTQHPLGMNTMDAPPRNNPRFPRRGTLGR